MTLFGSPATRCNIGLLHENVITSCERVTDGCILHRFQDISSLIMNKLLHVLRELRDVAGKHFSLTYQSTF